MFARQLCLCLATTLVVSQAACGQEKQLTDGEIRLIMVRASIAAYAGACPCPDTLNGAGYRCGDSSAYSKGGGERLLCRVTDVSDQMIMRYRELQAQP
jgi:hypothetical protein